MNNELVQRWVHVDINSYFATLLQQENPALRGRPVGVLKSAGRSCVIAASKEAKKLGVTTGCSLREARMVAPDLVTVPAHFDMCLSATTKLKKLFEELAPRVDIFSLDEAFIDLTDCQIIYPDAVAFGTLVQNKIKETLGEWVTCNVGVSYTKLLAKLASEVSAKGSVTEITPANRDLFLARARFSEVCGVGYRLEKRLSKFGITHPYQINFLPEAELQAEFGPFWSAQLRKIAQGEDTHFFTHQRQTKHMQSIGRSITDFKLCHSEEKNLQVLYNLTEEVIYKVRKLHLAGRQVSLSLQGGGKRVGTTTSSGARGWGSSQLVSSDHWGGHVTTTDRIRHVPAMFKYLRQLYQQWPQKFPVIRWSIGLSLLEEWQAQPLWPEWHQREQVYQAVDKLVSKYGLFTVRGSLLTNATLIKPEVTGFLGDRDFQLGRLQ